MKHLTAKVFSVMIALLVGIFSIWLLMSGIVWPVGKNDILCRLDLQRGDPNTFVFFKTPEKLERFCVAAKPEKRGERLSLTITGENNFLCSFSAITKPMRFSFSPGEIPPGTYKVVIKQEEGSHGGRVIIAKREIGLTGWQIWSRAYVGILVISGVWAGLARKSKDKRRRILSSFIFNGLLLGFILILVYLIFHEGGHTLAASIFGQCDWARSDFFGIHGTPRAGLKAGVQVEPWQRAIVSFAGPMLPTLAGWVLFLFWRSRAGSKFRNRNPIVNIYLTAIVGMCVFPFIAVLGYLSGLVSDGDWLGFIENVPWPLWLVKTMLWISLFVSGFILWYVGHEMWKIWKIQTTKIKLMLHQSDSKAM
jgi:hypothetical protein